MRSLVTTDELTQELAAVGRDEVLGARRIVAIEVLAVGQMCPLAAGVGAERCSLDVTVKQNQAEPV